mmetsp:Transcript_26158/g.60420  ORF Transcript_26158/g.60420 Transcript_26158/m.60420 type:complete len:326 (+) Transcript_26158:2-979(+)
MTKSPSRDEKRRNKFPVLDPFQYSTPRIAPLTGRGPTRRESLWVYTPPPQHSPAHSQSGSRRASTVSPRHLKKDTSAVVQARHRAAKLACATACSVWTTFEGSVERRAVVGEPCLRDVLLSPDMTKDQIKAALIRAYTQYRGSSVHPDSAWGVDTSTVPEVSYRVRGLYTVDAKTLRVMRLEKVEAAFLLHGVRHYTGWKFATTPTFAVDFVQGGEARRSVFERDRLFTSWRAVKAKRNTTRGKMKHSLGTCLEEDMFWEDVCRRDQELTCQRAVQNIASRRLQAGDKRQFASTLPAVFPSSDRGNLPALESPPSYDLRLPTLNR